MNSFVKIVTFASLALTLAACAGTATDPEDTSAGSETTSADDQALKTRLPAGCGWMLRSGTFCPQTATVQAGGPTCWPAPAHPGYHWEVVCGCF